MISIKCYGNLEIKDDEEVSCRSKEYVDAASNNGILVGYEDNTFKLRSNAKRIEVYYNAK